MSWGADIEIEHGDGYTTSIEVVDGHTYNLTPMWRLACAIPENEGSSWFDGKTTAELAPILGAALLDAVSNPAKYEALNPPNGWGDYEGFKEILARFYSLSMQHPTGVVRWNG